MPLFKATTEPTHLEFDKCILGSFCDCGWNSSVIEIKFLNPVHQITNLGSGTDKGLVLRRLEARGLTEVVPGFKFV
jgi:hypothetical protein